MYFHGKTIILEVYEELKLSGCHISHNGLRHLEDLGQNEYEFLSTNHVILNLSSRQLFPTHLVSDFQYSLHSLL